MPSTSQPSTAGERRHWRTRGLAALAIAGSLALAACTPDSGPVVVTETASAATPTADASPTASAAETAAPETPAATATAAPLPDADPPAADAPFTADTLPDTQAASAGAFLSPVNLRFGAHDGYDRIVIDLEGTGTPGWLGEYVDNPTQDGSGEPLVLAGDAYLRIQVTGVVYPTEPGASPYVGSTDVSPATGAVVEQIRYGSIFEGKVEVFIGVSSEQPFRVYALEDPTRVVIDIQAP